MCNQVLTYPLNIFKALAKMASFAILSFVLPGKRGIAALEARHCHDLTDHLGAGGIYTFSSLPQW
jgi:hypothetical protein